MAALTVEKATVGLSLQRQQDQVMHGVVTAGLDGHFHVRCSNGVSQSFAAVDMAPSVELPLHSAPDILTSFTHTHSLSGLLQQPIADDLTLIFTDGLRELGTLDLPQRFSTAALMTPCELLPQLCAVTADRVDGHSLVQRSDVGLHPAGGEAVEEHLQPLVVAAAFGSCEPLQQRSYHAVVAAAAAGTLTSDQHHYIQSCILSCGASSLGSSETVSAAGPHREVEECGEFADPADPLYAAALQFRRLCDRADATAAFLSHEFAIAFVLAASFLLPTPDDDGALWTKVFRTRVRQPTAPVDSEDDAFAFCFYAGGSGFQGCTDWNDDDDSDECENSDCDN